MGYNYFYNWAIGKSTTSTACVSQLIISSKSLMSLPQTVLPAELSASAILVNYWTKSVNNAVWITIFLVIVALINMGGGR